MEDRLCLDEDVAKDDKKKAQVKAQLKKQVTIITVGCVVVLSITVVVLLSLIFNKPPPSDSPNSIPPDAKLEVTAEKVILDIPEAVFAENPSFLAQVTVSCIFQARKMW